jgi:hypothetical protein
MRGLVLRWQAELIEHLVQERPPNQVRIMATALALVSHANPDGTRCRPGTRLIAHETGQHLGRAQDAMNWLVDEGWLTFTRRVAHGGREFTLTIPQRPGDEITESPNSDPVRESLDSQRPTQRVTQRPTQRPSEGIEPPTSYLLPESSSSELSKADFQDQHPELWAEAVRQAKERKAAGEPIRSVGAVAVLVARDLLEDSQNGAQARARQEALAAAVAACRLCDSRGLRAHDDRLEGGSIYTERCDHPSL